MSKERAKAWGRIAVRGFLAFLAIGVALYAMSYLVLRERIIPPPFLASFQARPWGIYPHAFFGAIALAIGWTQFSRRILTRRRRLHRTLGKIYVIAAMLCGAAGLYMAFYAFGGPVARAGLGGLAVALLSTTSIGLRKIRSRDVAAHRQWMLRSYATVFAAVMLRIDLPLLGAFVEDFLTRYRIVAWLCWVPNLIAVEIWLRATRARVAEPVLLREKMAA